MVSRPLWLIYALGGGFGHLTRASALARVASPETDVRILTNSPYTANIEQATPDLDLVALNPAMSVAQGCAEILRDIQMASPDCLIVDTFPRGLGGELAGILTDFSGLKVYVQRDLNPLYAEKYDLNSFVAKHYDLALVPGDATPDSLGPFTDAVTTAPWLIRSRHELLPRDRARGILGLVHEKPCIMVCAAGNSEELAWYGAVVSQFLECAHDYDVRCVAPVRPDRCPPDNWVSYWPAMDLYPAVAVVIGGAGYNTVYETIACGVPLVAKAWPRKYDRQYLRARWAARVVEEASQAVEAALELARVGLPTSRELSFENGAVAAIERIRQRAIHIT